MFDNFHENIVDCPIYNSLELLNVWLTTSILLSSSGYIQNTLRNVLFPQFINCVIICIGMFQVDQSFLRQQTYRSIFMAPNIKVVKPLGFIYVIC